MFPATEMNATHRPKMSFILPATGGGEFADFKFNPFTMISRSFEPL